MTFVARSNENVKETKNERKPQSWLERNDFEELSSGYTKLEDQ